MKKLGKISMLMFIFASLANSSLATVNNTIGSATILSESSVKSIVPLVIGSILICAVLFLGYKLDNSTKEESVENIKPSKKTKQDLQEITEKEEIEIYKNENKNDIAYYEEDKETFFEYDKEVDNDDLLEDKEYEEDDISLFMLDEENESSFENIDDDISFEENLKYKKDKDDFYSTMVFDSNGLNNEIEQDEDDFEYTEAVQGLEEKIDQLDELDSFAIETRDEQSAESFMEELKKYEPNSDENILSFTTDQETKSDEIKEKKKRNTKKKEEIDVVSEPDINFLNLMEENLKKDQETREEKSSKKSTTKKKTKKKE